MRVNDSVQWLAIGDIASESGFRASAIRYYESVGLLPAAERVSGRRRYRPETLDLLMLIRFCRRLGFGLADMRTLLAAPRGSRGKEVWRSLVDRKLDELQAYIAAARGVERVLKASRECECVSLASCSFLRDERTALERDHVAKRLAPSS